MTESKPIKNYQRYQMKIDHFADAGETVGLIGDVPVYVPNAIPGERVEVLVTEVRMNFARAKVEQVLTRSPKRVDPPCPFFDACGGCQWQHIEYKTQLEAKRKRIVDALAGTEELKKILVKETLPSPLTFNYRNKSQRPVLMIRNRVVTGFYYPRTHRLVPIEECMVEPKISNQLIDEVLRLIPKYNISPYVETRHEGVLRYIIVRRGMKTQNLMLILVTNAEVLPLLNELAVELQKSFPQVVSVIQNINREKTNVILGPENRVISGQPYFYESVGILKLRISPESFFQINTDQGEAICKIVQRYADLQGQEDVLDLYCGTGLIGLYLAGLARSIFGIESAPKAVDDAIVNAQENNIKNTRFLCADAKSGIQQLIEADIHPQVVIVDPPRQGCTREVLEMLIGLLPQKLIYVSCDMKTLVRDLAILFKLGYTVREIQPIDLFPQTSHVECVVYLTPNNTHQ